jgi:hypothetical protein
MAFDSEPVWKNYVKHSGTRHEGIKLFFNIKTFMGYAVA